jgi:hypothetical protein
MRGLWRTPHGSAGSTEGNLALPQVEERQAPAPMELDPHAARLPAHRRSAGRGDRHRAGAAGAGADLDADAGDRQPRSWPHPLSKATAFDLRPSPLPVVGTHFRPSPLGWLGRVLINRQPSADLDVPPNVRSWG